MSRLILSVCLLVGGASCAPPADPQPARHTGATRSGVGDDADGPNAPARPMSDGSNGSADDPDLKDAAVGVKYRDLKDGRGEPCPEGAEVTIHYTGWLESGEVFDSTREGPRGTGRPASFKLKNLIKGWQEGLPGMKKGGVRKLVVAPEKAYGLRGSNRLSGKTLIFEIELVDFTPPKDVIRGPGQPMPSDGSDGGTDDPGLKDLGGGLKIRDIKEGTGEPVKEGATVTVHYTGWLVDGTAVDSSKTRGMPFEADLAPHAARSVIKGWEKGIPGMKPGGIRKLVIPAALAYGDHGTNGIPSGATLIFEVELVK